MDQILFPISDRSKDDLEAVRLKTNILLLGLTGGIASGKSTVSNILKGMGATLIDFDLLARKVVEPGKPAWKEVVDFFGEEILLDDGNIDRKRLSSIVFKDTEKRRRLEGFTHPAIGEEFVKQVNQIASKDPDAIIQAVVPLLIEVRMQDLFHHILVVHIPREKQIERLIERDGIRREEAIDILDAQMPIDEKLAWADFVIHNGNSLGETRLQVKGLWERLSELQRSGTGGP